MCENTNFSSGVSGHLPVSQKSSIQPRIAIAITNLPSFESSIGQTQHLRNPKVALQWMTLCPVQQIGRNCLNGHVKMWRSFLLRVELADIPET